MRKRRLMLSFLAVILASSFIGNVNARGGVFLIEPMQEVTESVELTISDKTSANVAGSLSVTNGSVDFYITSPSGIILLCHNQRVCQVQLQCCGKWDLSNAFS